MGDLAKKFRFCKLYGCDSVNHMYHTYMVERQEIPYVTIPKIWMKSRVVVQQPGTRWYVEEGNAFGLRGWLHDLNKWVTEQTGGLLIPMQWVPAFVGVSRAAVQKRVRTGGLTVFTYVVMDDARGILGKLTNMDIRKNYDLVPYVECDAWRWILMEIANAREEFESE